MTRTVSYCLKTLAFTGICLGLLGAFNAVIDPYAVWGSRKYKGLNARKTEAFLQLSATKPYQFYQSDNANIILGSSRPGRAIDPDHSAIRAGNFYNFATPGATPEMDYLKLQAALSLRDVGRVIYFVDFFTFNSFYSLPTGVTEDFRRRLLLRDPVWSEPAFLLQALRDYSSHLWSYYALRDSILTIRKQQSAESGKIPYTELHENGLWHFAVTSDRRPIDAFRSMEGVYLRDTWFLGARRSFSLSEDEESTNKPFSSFRSILYLAHEADIELDIVILPVHARLLDVLDYAGLWENFEAWKRLLVDINHSVAQSRGRVPFPLWDFNGYHAMIDESVTEATNPGDIKWFYDSAHAHVDTGDRILDIVIADQPPEFGARIHPENIEDWLEDEKNRKRRFRAENPEVTGNIRERVETFLKRNPVVIHPPVPALELKVNKLRASEHTDD